MNDSPSMPNVHIPTEEEISGIAYKGARSLEVGPGESIQIGGGYQYKINQYFSAVERYNKEHKNELDGKEIDPLKVIALTNPINAAIAKEKKTLDQIIEYTIDNEEEILFAQEVLDEMLYREKLRFYTVQKEISEPHKRQESINDLLDVVKEEIEVMKKNRHIYSSVIFNSIMKNKLDWQRNLQLKLDPTIVGYNELMEEELEKLKELARESLKPTIVSILERLQGNGFIDIIKEDGKTYYVLNDDWEEGRGFLNREKFGKDAYLRAKYFEKNEMGLDETKDSNQRALEHIEEEIPVYEIIKGDVEDEGPELIGRDEMLQLLFK